MLITLLLITVTFVIGTTLSYEIYRLTKFPILPGIITLFFSFRTRLINSDLLFNHLSINEQIKVIF